MQLGSSIRYHLLVFLEQLPERLKHRFGLSKEYYDEILILRLVLIAIHGSRTIEVTLCIIKPITLQECGFESCYCMPTQNSNNICVAICNQRKQLHCIYRRTHSPLVTTLYEKSRQAQKLVLHVFDFLNLISDDTIRYITSLGIIISTQNIW